MREEITRHTRGASASGVSTAVGEYVGGGVHMQEVNNG